MGSEHPQPPRPSQTLVTIPVRNSSSSVAGALAGVAGVHWVGDIGSGQVRVLFDPSRVGVEDLIAVALEMDAEPDSAPDAPDGPTLDLPLD